MRTINIKPETSEGGSVDFHVWRDKEGWWSCRSGVCNGLDYESDDLGPFETEQEALSEQEDDYKCCLETTRQYENLPDFDLQV